jgi:glycosyltransferase involved in cell wall biosynthesis
MKEVVVIQRVVCEYRRAFFCHLRRRLADADINLRLVVGTPRQGEESIDVLDQMSFGERLPTIYFYRKVCWIRNLYSKTKTADMVIFVQENAALYTYPLLLARLLGRRQPRLAFWGHGANLGRRKSNFLSDLWRRFWLRRVDWWFAYTSKTSAILAEAAFPASKVTVVNNSTDTTMLREAVEKVDPKTVFSSIFGCRWTADKRVGVFCGRLIESKMVEFLLDSISKIHHRMPEFFMVIVGDGPLRECVQDFCEANDWCRWVGASWGSELAEFLAVADVWLNPGAVGLAVVDAFAVGIPLITTDNGMHGPEICYLETGKTGFITAVDSQSYTEAAVDVLADSQRLQQIKCAVEKSGAEYSVEKMAEHFTAGIRLCLAEQSLGDI